MLGWVHMLRTGTLAPDRRERALETIERNARAQAQLIEDLLDVSRILSGKLRLQVAVALTAYARTEDRTRALLSGFNNHVTKPVEPLELLAVVASLANRTQQQSD
ncbi:MAG: hypothetical protein RLZZ450_4756 [Pseudomonadota bacterium]|jgi:CheY-like chemotaxis protein